MLFLSLLSSSILSLYFFSSNSTKPYLLPCILFYSGPSAPCTFISLATFFFFFIAWTASQTSTRLAAFNRALFGCLSYSWMSLPLELLPAGILSYLPHVIVPLEVECAFLVVLEAIEAGMLKVWLYSVTPLFLWLQRRSLADRPPNRGYYNSPSNKSSDCWSEFWLLQQTKELRILASIISPNKYKFYYAVLQCEVDELTNQSLNVKI